jgi:hypothetical protein
LGNGVTWAIESRLGLVLSTRLFTWNGQVLVAREVDQACVGTLDSVLVCHRIRLTPKTVGLVDTPAYFTAATCMLLHVQSRR